MICPQGAPPADADPEPQLAAGERRHRGAALVLVCRGTARVVDPDDYQLYTWEDWRSYCRTGTSRASARCVCASGCRKSSR